MSTSAPYFSTRGHRVRLEEVDVLMCGQPLCVALRPILETKSWLVTWNFLWFRLYIPGVASIQSVKKKAQDTSLAR